MRDASASVPELLKPLAVAAGKLWLTKKGYGDEAYLDKSEFEVWFLKGYRSLDEQGNISEQLSNFIWARDGHFRSMSADEIEELAVWTGLPKTTHWHTGLGWILWEASEEERARYFLNQAIELVRHIPHRTQRPTRSVISSLTNDRTPTLGSQWKPWHEVSAMKVTMKVA